MQPVGCEHARLGSIVPWKNLAALKQSFVPGYNGCLTGSQGGQITRRFVGDGERVLSVCCLLAGCVQFLWMCSAGVPEIGMEENGISSRMPLC